MINSERGSIFVVFSMLLLTLFAVLALVADLGYARLAQSQMQSATDSGSIFGLRTMGNNTLSLEEQRIQTSRFVRGVFDDNSIEGEVGLESDDYQFGAGPIVTMTTSASGIVNQMDADQIEREPVYKPVLEANIDNLQYGDMVVGDFGVSGLCDEGLKNHEDANYCRDDFLPNQTGNDFLVRMRRTNDVNGLDDELGVSTSGGRLPYLFARGSGLMAALSQGGGISVRATSIARSSPVFRAGVAVEGIVGVSSFALEETFWNGLEIEGEGVDSVLVDLVVESEGTIHLEGDIVGGFVFDSHNDSMQLSIAQEISFLTPQLDTLDSTALGVYVPIYANIDGRNLIVGFGRAQMVRQSGNFPNEAAGVVLTKLRGGRVHQNASGILRTFPAGITTAEFDEVLLRNNDVNEQILIPVLTR